MSIQEYRKQSQASQLAAFFDKMNSTQITNQHPPCNMFANSSTQNIDALIEQNQILEEYRTAKRKKILIIGQAPPAVEQTVPYDTTFLYSWLSECNIDKDTAQQMFIFDATVDKFPGHTKSNHIVPLKKDMNEYWERSLKEKVKAADRILVLGGHAEKFFKVKTETMFLNLLNIEVLYLIHPSKRNIFKIRQIKNELISNLHNFIYY